jgi:hypothetical protein
MTPRPNYPADDSMKKEQYQRLLNELKTMIEQSQAAEVNLSERAHLLTCSDCGAYEDINEDEQLLVYDQEEEITLHSEFIIIDGKQRIYEKKQQHQYLTTYTFICPVCGVYQTAIIREKFDEEAGV